jgi:pyruvate formate lyase activating enzyme
VNIDIRGIIESSFLDWDGKIVSTLYVPKCNFRCPFCHNWDLIENPDKFESKSFDVIKAYLLEQKDFLDGICLTGGEPCLYQGLPEFLKRIRGLGMETKLDTNGSFPDMLGKVIEEGLVDYIAMDVKAPLDERYDKAAGVSVDIGKIKSSIDIIMKSGVDYEFRTTVVPTILEKVDLKEIAEYLTGARRYVLQQFVPDNSYSPDLREVKPYEKQMFDAMTSSGGKYVEEILVRGNVD